MLYYIRIFKNLEKKKYKIFLICGTLHQRKKIYSELKLSNKEPLFGEIENKIFYITQNIKPYNAAVIEINNIE